MVEDEEKPSDNVKLIKLELKLLYDTTYIDKKDEMIDWGRAFEWVVWWLLGITMGITTTLYFGELVDPLMVGWFTGISAAVIVVVGMFRALRRP